MKKQYLAIIVRNNGWEENAVLRVNARKKRCANTFEEAKEAIEFCYKEFTTNDVGKESMQVVGSIGVSVHLDKNTYEQLKVVAHSISVREVTEWEELECKDFFVDRNL